MKCKVNEWISDVEEPQLAEDSELAYITQGMYSVFVPTRASALGLCFLLPHTVPRISNGACTREKVVDTWILTRKCRRAPRQSPVLWPKPSNCPLVGTWYKVRTYIVIYDNVL